MEDGGEYTCVAKNLAGQATHSSRLNVYGLPYIRNMPKMTAVAEADVSIKCPVAGYPIMEIAWTRGEFVFQIFSLNNLNFALKNKMFEIQIFEIFALKILKSNLSKFQVKKC